MTLNTILTIVYKMYEFKMFVEVAKFNKIK